MNDKQQLKKKLANIRSWAQKDIQNAREDITVGTSQQSTHNFFISNISSIIEDKIHRFFPHEVLMNFPVDGVSQILSSELVYYNIIKGAPIDGISVLIGYQKVFENMIELYITDPFRKYVDSDCQSIISPSDHHLDKSLYKVVIKKYIISVGRLYELLKILRDSQVSGKYIGYFKKFLKSNTSLQKSLHNDNFFLQLEALVEMQVFGYKRHSGFISEEETKRIRTIFIGDFMSPQCLLYTLAATESIF